MATKEKNKLGGLFSFIYLTFNLFGNYQKLINVARSNLKMCINSSLL